MPTDRKISSRLFLALVGLAVSASLLSGCAATSKGTIRASEVDATMRGVIERHNAYVVADEALSQPERSTYLTSSALVLNLLDEAAK